MEIKTTLWEQVAKGDEESYAELFRTYYKKLFNYGKKFTEDETLIEDTAQETFVIVWQKRHQLQQVEFPVTYLLSRPLQFFQSLLYPALPFAPMH